MVVRLPACTYEPEHLLWASVGNLWEPLVYSQWASRATAPTYSPSPVRFFNRALEHSLRSAPPLQDSDLTGSWLSALIYMDAIMRASSIDDLVSQWPGAGKAVETNELLEVSALARQTCTALQISVNQVADFRKSYPSVRQSDYRDAYHFLERLLREAKDMAEQIKDTLDTQHQINNIEMSSLAVHESKSAIAGEFHAQFNHKAATYICHLQSPFSHSSSFPSTWLHQCTA